MGDAVTNETLTFYQNEDVPITYTAPSSIDGFTFEAKLKKLRDKTATTIISVTHAEMTIVGLTVSFTFDKAYTNVTPGTYYLEIRGTDATDEEVVAAVTTVNILPSITADV